jgi:hypothetical protein
MGSPAGGGSAGDPTGTTSAVAYSADGMPAAAEDRYGLPSKWDFRPPHPVGHGIDIVEMPLEAHRRATA